ncbi:MAG: beta strand repeat-containing protein [Terriglobia bacterium]
MTLQFRALFQEHPFIRRAAVFVVFLSLSIALSAADSFAANPVPLINQPLVPTTAAPGGAAFTLTVNGTGFVNGATVNWNGSARTTTFVSGEQLTATINATDVAVAGTASVTVVNPTPGGGTSNVVFFPIANPTTSPVFANAPGSPINEGSNLYSVAVGDFNGDGKLDLAVANYFSSTLTILLGNGDGTFTPTGQFLSTGANPRSVAVGDFNGDGKLDLAVANQFSNTVTILLGDGAGIFTPTSVSPTTDVEPYSVVTGDFNGDGNLDLAVANNCGKDPSCTSIVGTVTILLGDGTGNFTPTAVSPATGGNPRSVVVGDFNGDGKLDLAVANYYNSTLTILLGDGTGNFTPTSVSPATGLDPFSVTAGDFNGDGKLDLAVANQFGDTLTILLGDGTGNFTPTSVSPTTGSEPVAVVAGDFNGDGKLDLAVAGSNSNRLTILLGDGAGNFTPTSQVSPTTGSQPVGLAVADFNGDGRLDLAVANLGSETVSILLQVPTVTLIPTSLSFGNQLVGSTSTAQTVTLTNNQGVTLHFASIVASGDFATPSNTCGTSVAAGAHCAINVAFTPSTTGIRTGTLTVDDDAPGSPQTVSLSGTGVGPPVASLSPSSLSFSPQSVGTTSGPQPVTLSNTGNAALTITSIATSANFGQTSTCAGSVAAGFSCTINVTFSPTATGPLTGTLTITDNGNGVPGSTQTVTLSGTGTAPLVSLSAPSLSFGSQPLSTTSAAQTETVTNTGTANLTISTVTVGGTNASDFAKSADTCTGATVAPTSTCAVSVTFTPSATGSRSASLNFTDNASNSPQTVNLSGTGGGPVVSLSAPSLSFGNQPLSTTSAAQTETITNTGTGNLSISTVTMGGTDASDFAKSADTCTGAAVAPNGACTVSVTFTPAATGTRSGTLTFTDNNNSVAGSTQAVALSGLGADFAVASPTGTQTVAQGGNAQYAINVTSVGGTFSNAITLACSNLPAQTTCAFGSNPVTPGASGASSQLTLTTAAPAYAMMVPPSTGLPPAALPALLLAMMPPALVGWWRVRRKSPRWAPATCLLFGALLAATFMAGCGTGGYPLAKVGGTPVGNYTVTVTGTSGSTQHTTTVTLTVTAS